MTTLALSVVFSSFNGAEKLPGMLDSLVEAENPLHGFEIIAVDNASSDNTVAVLESRKHDLPLTILHEPRAGKNYALNRAVAVAKGELLVFTDDDVFLPTNFLTTYEEIAARENSFDIFGGHIVPHWPLLPDPQILAEVPLGTAYAITDRDRKEGIISANRLYGPNMAMRRSIFDAGMKFDESIGPNGGRYVMGDETDLLLRAEAEGFKAFFIPSIAVEHRVRKEQLDISWIEGRAFIAGRSLLHNQRRLYNGRLPETKRLFGLPRWALRRLIAAELAVFLCFTKSSKHAYYTKVWERGFMRGYVGEYYRNLQLGK